MRVAAALELLHELRVRREAVGDAEQLLVERAEPVGGDGGHDLLAGRGRNVRVVGPRRRLGRAERLLERLVRGLELREDALLELGGLLLGDVAFGDELRRELLAHRRVLGDRGGEERLRVRGLVLLVVAVPPVADEVDDDVVAEAQRDTRARAGSPRAPPPGRRR